MDDESSASPEDQQITEGGDGGTPEPKKADDKPENKTKADRPSEGKKDDEHARKDRFATVAGDPLADFLGIPSEEAGRGQAYQSWRETLQASGPAAFVGGSNFGVLNVNVPPGAYERRGQAPGPVRREVIDELKSKYAPV